VPRRQLAQHPATVKMNSLKGVVHSVITDPDLQPLLAIVKAARNGAVYGAKVRFPHALVMVFLFRSGTIREKIRLVLRATRTHARNLAYFATVYKSTMLLIRYANPMNGGKEGAYDSFFAGLVGGYTVFGKGKQGSVSKQIVIFVFARVMLALARLSVQPPSANSRFPLLPTQMLSPEVRAKIHANAWPVFASLSWAFVMFIFRWEADSIQPSLRSSMKYIYVDSDHWNSFRNFLIHNV